MTRVIVGISGASGAAVAVETLRLLAAADVETHLVVSKWGAVTLQHECGMTARDLAGQVAQVHSNADMAAPISSGSFRVDGMIVAPCSARTLGSIATGTGDTLISRAADVVLKERRRLVVGLREAPLSTIHLRNAIAVSEAGGVIYPLVPTFYANPDSLDEMITGIAARLVDLAGVETAELPRWTESVDLRPRADR